MFLFFERKGKVMAYREAITYSLIIASPDKSERAYRRNEQS